MTSRSRSTSAPPRRVASSPNPRLRRSTRSVAQLSDSGVESVAVCFLNSYANPANERAVAEQLEKQLGVPVCISAEISPQIREYPRMITTACNAVTMPVIGPYLDELQRWLAAEGFGGSVLMMLSNGGVVSAADAARVPIRLVESGPAAGALAGSWFARRLGEQRLLCFDMGGTTAKSCLIEAFEPELTNTFEVARMYRFKKGSGFPVSVPSVDLVEIGAGGGSLARVDDLGLLKVGPESAGAAPGPASYGRGGTKPAVTDADVLLGYLDPDFFLGGDMKLDRGAADAAVAAVADGLGLAGDRHRRGHPRRGQPEHGGGVAHARRRAGRRSPRCVGDRVRRRGSGARVRGCRSARVEPRHLPGERDRARPPSARSCRRCASTSPARWSVSWAPSPSTSATACSASCGPKVDVCSRQPVSPRATCGSATASTRATPGRATRSRIWVGEGDEWPGDDAMVREDFEREYRRIYGLTIPDVGVEIVTWRVSAVAHMDTVEPAVPEDVAARGTEAVPHRTRPVVFHRGQPALDVPVYRRETLGLGARVRGPGHRRGTRDDRGDPSRMVGRGRRGRRLADRNPQAVRRWQHDDPPFDPIELEVLWQSLIATVNEQAKALQRAAFSPIVREAGDLANALFDRDGRMVAQAVTGTPGHINSLARAATAILEEYPLDELEPGDILVTNDPYKTAGQLLDVTVFSPVWRNGRRASRSSVRRSTTPTSAATASVPARATCSKRGCGSRSASCWCKGERNNDVWKFILSNVRQPDHMAGDLHAQIASGEVGSQRLNALCDAHGLDDIDELGAEIIRRSEDATRDSIRALAEPARTASSATLDLADGSHHRDRAARSRSTRSRARSPSTTKAAPARARSASTSSRTTRTRTRRSRCARVLNPDVPEQLTAASRRSRSRRPRARS